MAYVVYRAVFYVRYWTCYVLLRLGIAVMPPGSYKDEFTARVYGLRNEAVAQARKRRRAER